MANYTTLSKNDIDTLIAQYAVGDVLDFAIIQGGASSSSYIVRTSTGIFVLTICDEKEFLMIIKTSEKHLKNIQKRITELHHYEVPEIIFIPIETGLPEYLNWINQNTDRNA